MSDDEQYVTVDLFSGNKFLHAIALKDLDMAKWICQEFSGEDIYILKWGAIKTKAEKAKRNDFIVSQRKKLVSPKRLAKITNLSERRVKQISADLLPRLGECSE
jgi:hypothetical protein